MTHVHNQANYVGDQSFNMMMNVMMNTQSCYQPVNNYQLGTVAQTGLETPKIESTKNLYVKRSEFLKVTGHEDNDRQAVIKVRGIIKGKLNAHGMRDEEPHYRNAENSSVYSFDITSGQTSETYRIKVTMPERREFFFIDFERLDCDYDDERDTTELARRCMEEINYMTGTTSMPDAGKACQWAKERKTEPENLYFAPLPEKYRNHDKKSIQDVVIGYMKRHYDLDVAIENAKIGEGKKSQGRLPIAFCRFKSSEQARQVELKMNGKKWSELGFEFCDMDEDKTMTVKKANKQTKLDERVFQHGAYATTTAALTAGAAAAAQAQMVQQVQLPVSAVPTISNPNGIWILNGAQLLPNAQLGLCYYSVNQQTDANGAPQPMAIESTNPVGQQFCQQTAAPLTMGQFGTQSLLSTEPVSSLQPFPAPSPMSPPAPLDMGMREDQHQQMHGSVQAVYQMNENNNSNNQMSYQPPTTQQPPPQASTHVVKSEQCYGNYSYPY